jgi:hypothetical protein
MRTTLLLLAALLVPGCSDEDKDVSITILDGTDFSTLEQIAAPPSRSIATLGNGRSTSLVSVTDARTSAVTLLDAQDDGFVRHSYSGPPDRGVATADLEGDGVQEVLVLGNGHLVVYRLDSSRELELAGTYEAFADRAFAVGDLDNDSIPDVVSVGNGLSGGIVEVRMNVSGALAAPVTYESGLMPTGVAVADLNADGMADIAVANLESSSITILWATATGFFQREDIPSVGGAHEVLPVDLDDDGDQDLVIAGLSKLDYLFNAGDASFESHMLALPAVGGEPWAVAELRNPDGSLAIVGTDANDASIWVSSRATGFVPMSRGMGIAPVPIALAVGDVNGDGTPDIVVGSYGVAPTL